MLGPISARTFLWSMQRISSNEELASHWLHHYGALGIRMRTHAHIVVHATSEQERTRARTLLDEHGVSRIQFVPEFSSAIKTALVNDFIARELPLDGLLIYSDADEFFSYPPDVLKLSRQSYAICSSMVDRLASDLNVPRLRAWSEQAPLSQQFPICAPLRQRIASSGGWMKLTLLRARIRGVPPVFVNTHVAIVNLTRRVIRIGGNGQRLCAYTGGFSHFMHSQQGYAMLRSKLALYQKMRRMVSVRVYKAHLRLVEQVKGGKERFTPTAAALIRNASVPCTGTLSMVS